MRELIFISLENWDDIWRRNQFLCAEFSRRFPGLRILFVGIHKDLSYVARSGDLNHLFAKTPRHPKGFPNITLCRPLKFMPTKFPIGRRFNERVMRQTIEKWSRKLGFSNPILWINPHYAAHLVGKLGESKVIYDITDDWTALNQPKAITKLTIAQDAALCQSADHTIVCSQGLLESKTGICRDLHLIPNGVEIEHYKDVLNTALPLPPAAANWPKPVLGYTGTCHPERVDINLVTQIARGLTRGSIVFVGPHQLSETDRRKLAACGNVFLHGPVPYQEIPSYMRAFDICITPHLVTPFTESLNPLKLWEYLAAGKPIISTPVAGFRDHPQHVTLAQSAPDFLAAINCALTEPPEKKHARQQEVIPHSWQARADQIAQLLEKPLRPQPAPDRMHLIT